MGAKKLINTPELRVVRNAIKITNSQQAYDLFKDIWNTDSLFRFESVYAVFLNENCEVIQHELLNIGTRRSTPLDKRRLLGDAYTLDASWILLAHNHPSGNARPSDEDIDLTKELKYLCDALDFKFADHIIIGRDGYYSFRDANILK